MLCRSFKISLVVWSGHNGTIVIIEVYSLNLAGLELYILCEFMSFLVSVDGNLEYVVSIGSERLDGEVESGFPVLCDRRSVLYCKI